jgi:hypothetical protein
MISILILIILLGKYYHPDGEIKAESLRRVTRFMGPNPREAITAVL